MIALSQKRSRLLTVLALVITQSVVCFARDGNPPTARVVGVVSDRQQAIYQAPNSVSIRCIQQSRCGKTMRSQMLNPRGEFSFVLPPGVYELSAKVRWAFPYKRAPLYVSPGKDVFVRITPRLQILGVSLNVEGPDVRHAAPPVKYEQVLLSKDQKALVEYETKTITGHKSVYTYATLTYGNWSITGDSITIDQDRRVIEPEGRSTTSRGPEFSDAKTISFESLLETSIWPSTKQ